jgi:hypothetical protein
MLIPRTGPSLSYVLPLVPVTRPLRRSRGGSGTSSDATGGNGTRSGLEWSDRPAGLRGMTRHRPLPRGPLQSWIVRTLSGRTCSKSCQQLPGGSRWGPSLAHTPRTTRPLSCFTSLTNRSTMGPNSAYCVTCTDMTVVNPPALRTTTDSNREGGVTGSRRAPEMPPEQSVARRGCPPVASADLAQTSRSQHLAGQLGRGERVRAQHERPDRLAGGGNHHLIHAGHAELAGCLVPLLARVGHAGIEPLPEYAGIRLQEDVQDLLARSGPAEAAASLAPARPAAPAPGRAPTAALTWVRGVLDVLRHHIVAGVGFEPT